ncbi:unnamed protein product, partial [Rotaria magnacalcarata]
MINEWNSRTSLSLLCKNWKKDRPKSEKQNLTLLISNVEGLNTHVADVDLLIASHQPNICILTEIGAAIRKQIKFPNYNTIAQHGTNAFGGVIILYQQHLKCKIIDTEANFLMIELTTNSEAINIGAIYVPPNTLPPFTLLAKYHKKPFYIFGDFNAKHTDWGCKTTNTSGSHLRNWLESTGNVMITPTKSTSKRSNAIINFGITHNASDWTSEVLNEGTSDHFPIIFQSSIAINDENVFRKTNWKLFNFFLYLVHEYWMSLVYNLDEQTFFSLFSSFLSALWDKCSEYVSATRYRKPWPPELLLLAKVVNRARRSYRRNKSNTKLLHYISLKDIFIDKRNHFLYNQKEQQLDWISNGNNIWKYAKPIFHAYSPQFKGLKVDSKIITANSRIVEILANFFEKHFSEPDFDESNNNHLDAMLKYKQMEYIPNIPIESITLNEVELEWNKFKSKKSSDSAGTSAFLLKQLPKKYINIITVLFNKCAGKGEFFNG